MVMAEAVILSLGRLAGDGRRGAVRHNPFRTLVAVQLFLQVRVKIITRHRFWGVRAMVGTWAVLAA